MSATVSPRSRIRANAAAPSRRCSARRCSASSRTCACRSASHSLTALSFCRRPGRRPGLPGCRILVSAAQGSPELGHHAPRRTSCLDSIGAIVANLRLPGQSALTLAPPCPPRIFRLARSAPGNGQPPRISCCEACASYVPRGPSVQIEDRLPAWRSPTPPRVLGRLRSLLPGSFPNRISRWLHHIHPIHCHHTVPIQLRNRPIIEITTRPSRPPFEPTNHHTPLALRSRFGNDHRASVGFDARQVSSVRLRTVGG